MNVHSEFVRTTQNTNSNSTSLQSSSRPPTSTSPNRIELEAKLEETISTPISVAMNISGKVSVAIVVIFSPSSNDLELEGAKETESTQAVSTITRKI